MQPVVLPKGAEADKADHRNVSPLQMASLNGHAGAVQMLLEARADPNKATCHAAGEFTSATFDFPSVLHPTSHSCFVMLPLFQTSRGCCDAFAGGVPGRTRRHRPPPA